MEKIRTDRPITQDRVRITKDIAKFWNKTSEGWQTIWGPHIHHGYFEHRGETAVEAQEKLLDKLLALLTVSPQHRILDVGCGLGGSSLYLARNYGVKVIGITLSQKQVDMATHLATKEKIQDVTFQVEDALSLASFSEDTFDIVWSLESCEQFYDKQLFIEQAFRVLKPGGKLLLATWCSDAEEYHGDQANQYQKLCASLQLPYMPTMDTYAQLLQHNGFSIHERLDWSVNVKDTWEVGLASLRSYSVFKIFQLSGWRGLSFGLQGKLMQKAFDEHRVEYGVFLAVKA